MHQLTTTFFKVSNLQQHKRIELFSTSYDTNWQYYAKRVLDVTIVLFALLTLWPLLLGLALLIKLDSEGPAFFVQERVGARRRTKNGRAVWEPCKFRMYKFRSMRHNADQGVHQAYIKAFVEGQLSANDANGQPKFKMATDPRITKIGRFIRKTSLDELPQLLNVLKGEMSLVGPRPVPEYEVALYKDEHYVRLLALPGLTGLWQVKGRGEVTFDQMMQLDLEYVRNQSLALDLWILIMTIPATVFGWGAV
ncbi:MAG: sugar transferase [Caldilineaceae bacterium]